MRISESRLRKVIRNVIKENYDTVPTAPGIYTSENKHVAGNLWKLLGCYKEVKKFLEQYTPNVYSKVQADIVLNKIVFGNYGPSYNFNAGIYFGGFNWTTETDEADSRLEDPSEIVDLIISSLGLRFDLDQLKKKYSGQNAYQQLLAANPPNNPPNNSSTSSIPPNNPPNNSSTSSNSFKGGERVNQNVVIGRHCLGTYLSPFGRNEYEKFFVETGLEPMTDASRKHQTICLILFFEDNKPVSYHSLPYTSTDHIRDICYKWIDNNILPKTNIKSLDNGQSKDFINLNNLPKSDIPFVHGDGKNKYWTLSGQAKIATAVAIR